MKPPAFQFYADDFLAGTMDLSQSEVGAYIRLLCHQWNRGSTPVEPEKQQRIAGGPVSKDVLSKFELCPDGLLRNMRLEKERDKQRIYREMQAEKGRKSGEVRRTAAPTAVEPRLNNGCDSVRTGSEPNTNSPSPSPKETSGLAPLMLKGTDSELTEGKKGKSNGYHKDTRTVLYFLNESTGKHFREVDSNLSLISQRLKEEGVDLKGVQEMITHQVVLWSGTEHEQYLRPETLFGKKKFDGYYANRNLPVKYSNKKGCGNSIRDLAAERNSFILGADTVQARIEAEYARDEANPPEPPFG